MERYTPDHPAAGPGDTALFSKIARNALSYLRETVGFELWMVTRIDGNSWVVLGAEDHSHDVKFPATFKWEGTLCYRMVRGEGPCIAPCCAVVPAYAESALTRQAEIGAYIGVPLTNPDGSLFGTLCAFDSRPQPEAISTRLPLIELIAELLSGVLSAEIRAVLSSHHAERARTQAETDFLTGLHNRRGWDRALSLEEMRCEQYGHPACVIAIDIDGLKSINDSRGHAAGDDLIMRAGATLKKAMRDIDVVARVGGDEFLVLGVGCSPADSVTLLKRVTSMLDKAGVSASIGISRRTPTVDLSEAVQQADLNMYAEKNKRKRTLALCTQRFGRDQVVAV